MGVLKFVLVAFVAGAVSSYGKAPLTDKYVVFYTPKTDKYLGYGKDFDVQEAKIVEREQILDVKPMEGNSWALVIKTKDAFGKIKEHNMTTSVGHQAAVEELLTNRTPGNLWLPNPGFAEYALNVAWQETYAHIKRPESQAVQLLKTLASETKEELTRQHQLETGEYGFNQWQKAVDWSVGVGVFRSHQDQQNLPQ